MLWWLIAWLACGLLCTGAVCARQWRYLARSARADEDAAAARRRRYGQRRALWSAAEDVEALLRVLLWLAAGGLAGLYGLLGGAALGTLGFVMLFAALDRGLRELSPWARWWLVDRALGISRTSARELLADSARRIGVDAVLGLIGALLVLWPFALWPPAPAWAASTAAMLAAAIALFWARPNLIDPLFVRFRPLPEGELRARLTAMLARCGTRLDDVDVIDSSRRTHLANAYVTGLGRHKRVVLSDTLIERLPPAELEAVLAHELGHERCGHIRRYYASLAALMGLGYLACGGLWLALAPATPAPVAVLAAYIALPGLAWPLRPWLAARRRRYEYEADAYSAAHASPAALIAALERLLANNLNPAAMDPWYARLFATHPPGDARLARLRSAAAGG